MKWGRSLEQGARPSRASGLDLCQDSIQVHLKAERGPVVVLTCDVGTGEDDNSCFLTLEESRIRTTELHTGQYHTLAE